jgi:hypothetical protein
VVVDIFTTEGLSLSAKSAKLSGALLAFAKLVDPKIMNKYIVGKITKFNNNLLNLNFELIMRASLN